MILRGIIESLPNPFHAKVRIPSIDKAEISNYAVDFEDLSTAIIACPPGMRPHYIANDVVLLGFENDEIDKPVVLGLLYRREETNAIADLSLNTLNVKVNSKLSGDLQIGSASKVDFDNISCTKGNLQAQIDLLEQEIKKIKEKVGD